MEEVVGRDYLVDFLVEDSIYYYWYYYCSNVIQRMSDVFKRVRR